MTDAVMTDAVMTDAVMTDAVMTDAVMTDAVMTDAPGYFSNRKHKGEISVIQFLKCHGICLKESHLSVVCLVSLFCNVQHFFLDSVAIYTVTQHLI